MYKVYIYRNEINSKVYIGQTKNTLEERALNGLRYKGCTYFYNAIQKYGWDKFHGAILEDNLTFNQANEKEKFWINYFHANDPKYGYNICNGGNNLNGAKKGQPKKVFCIEEQKWFDSLSDAAEWAGLSRKGGTNLGQAALGIRSTAGIHPITKKDLHWSYKEIPYDSKCQTTNTKAKKVKNITTGMIYKSIREAMKQEHISQSSIIKSCSTGMPVGKSKSIWMFI